jgi:hypothetical protein
MASFFCFILLIFISSHFLLVYFHNARGACGAAPKGLWRCFLILSYFILVCFLNTHRMLLVGLPQGVGGLVIWFCVILVYFHNTHQVLIEQPQGVDALTILFYI